MTMALILRLGMIGGLGGITDRKWFAELKRMRQAFIP
jgi:hypothetical protein